jgi:poly(A) polymerase
VRDLLLGVKPKDFDIATNATPEEVKKLFRRAFIIGRRFQIVHVMFGQELLEVTTFRGNAAATTRRRTSMAASCATMTSVRSTRMPSGATSPSTPCTTIRPRSRCSTTTAASRTSAAKILRIIGQPEARYREDPVRMLRVVRFAAKLQFTIEPATRAPIPVMAPLINNVPAARVFDEMLKLLMSGHALACLKELRSAGLHHGLLPLLDVVLEQPIGMKFVTLALESTDARVRAGKGVSPGFLFASLLWHQVLEKWNAYRAAGEAPIPALHLAADDVLDNQTDKPGPAAPHRHRHARHLGHAAALRAPQRQGALQTAGASALPRRLRLPAAALRIGRTGCRHRQLVGQLLRRRHRRARTPGQFGARAGAGRRQETPAPPRAAQGRRRRTVASTAAGGASDTE